MLPQVKNNQTSQNNTLTEAEEQLINTPDAELTPEQRAVKQSLIEKKSSSLNVNSQNSTLQSGENGGIINDTSVIGDEVMAVQTPSYWQEEKYQPLVEVETAYGNKVKIPERCLIDWNAFQEDKEIAIPIFKQAIADGLYEGDKRRKFGVDLRKVFIESYQE